MVDEIKYKDDVYMNLTIEMSMMKLDSPMLDKTKGLILMHCQYKNILHCQTLLLM